MMNRSIQFIVCVLAILCQNINPAVAQTRSYDGVISVVPVQLEQRGKSVYINIDFVLEDVKVNRHTEWILFRNWLLLHILTIFRKYPSRDIMNTWRMNVGFH